ncbi:MAG: sigma-70 region 4 domain-containing protein [Chloroflexota bacterium]|nr:sigma-70 region 4 domain-containing protein [Chloroflexota bacterium]MDQ5866037.1 sigma-70 region 4 domain-containing protein [Chloroflexota bacterium]
MPLEEGQWVRLTVELVSPTDEMMALIMHFYDGLSEEEIAGIEKIVLDRSNFFPERDWSWLDDEEAKQ